LYIYPIGFYVKLSNLLEANFDFEYIKQLITKKLNFSSF